MQDWQRALAVLFGFAIFALAAFTFFAPQLDLVGTLTEDNDGIHSAYMVGMVFGTMCGLVASFVLLGQDGQYYNPLYALLFTLIGGGLAVMGLNSTSPLEYVLTVDWRRLLYAETLATSAVTMAFYGLFRKPRRAITAVTA